jgi:hypothetical protein
MSFATPICPHDWTSLHKIPCPKCKEAKMKEPRYTGDDHFYANYAGDSGDENDNTASAILARMSQDRQEKIAARAKELIAEENRRDVTDNPLRYINPAPVTTDKLNIIGDGTLGNPFRYVSPEPVVFPKWAPGVPTADPGPAVGSLLNNDDADAMIEQAERTLSRDAVGRLVPRHDPLSREELDAALIGDKGLDDWAHVLSPPGASAWLRNPAPHGELSMAMLSAALQTSNGPQIAKLLNEFIKREVIGL